LLTWPRAEIPRDNRRLVETAVHPEILHALAVRMGPSWLLHERALRGHDIAHRQTAQLNLVRRDLGFTESAIAFPDRSVERLRTRLGWEDRLVRFPLPPASPFGGVVADIKVPWHLFGGAFPGAGEEEAQHVRLVPGGFEFRYGADFRYDRWGLRPANQAAPS
jgi:CRISPR-associated endonuclease/helicase Cas3